MRLCFWLHFPDKPLNDCVVLDKEAVKKAVDFFLESRVRGEKLLIEKVEVL